ncbi:hypothetical protein GCM10017687_39020 [Streptomyces echinatus]
MLGVQHPMFTAATTSPSVARDLTSAVFYATVSCTTPLVGYSSQDSPRCSEPSAYVRRYAPKARRVSAGVRRDQWSRG